MPEVEMNLAELHPGDFLRQESLGHLETLSSEQILALGTLQVWQTPLGNVVSDGNNRIAALHKKGLKSAPLDYVPAHELPEYLNPFMEEMLARVRKMRNQGIYFVKDLFRA